MGPEARIGIVAGLIIVVIASVYFFYGNDRKEDDILLATGSKVVTPPKIPPAADQKAVPAAPAKTRPAPAPRPILPRNAQGEQQRLAGGSARPASPAGSGAGSVGPVAASAAEPARPGGLLADRERLASSDKPSSGTPGRSRGGESVQPPADILRSGPSAQLVDATRDNLEDQAGAPISPTTQPVHPRSTFAGAGDGARSGLGGPSGPVAAPWSMNRRPGTAPSSRPASPPSGSADAEPSERPRPADESAPTLAGARTPPAGARPGRSTGPRESTAGPSASTPAAAWPKQHKIDQGDTLAAIAEVYYGDSSLYPAILKANAKLKDPRALKIGDVLTIPEPPARSPSSAARAPASPVAAGPSRPVTATPAKATASPPGAARTYTVRADDTLYSIAHTACGSSARWKDILELNRDVLKNDPRNLRPGMILKLP